jgi:hypothetical protein
MIVLGKERDSTEKVKWPREEPKARYKSTIWQTAENQNKIAAFEYSFFQQHRCPAPKKKKAYIP